MANPFPFLLPFQLSDIGAPLVAGELSTYAIGTSDPKATYIDENGTTENTNPIILNSAGRFRCFLGVGGYKFVLRDALGNLIWTQNFLNSAGGGGGGGSLTVVNTIAALRALQVGSTDYVMVMGYYVGGDIAPRTYKGDLENSEPDDGGGVIGSGSGRWILEWDDKPVDVRWFGATGDGSSNDAPNVLSAQSWALAKNLKSGIVFTHVPVYYNLGSDAVEITCEASFVPGGQIKPPTGGLKFSGCLTAGIYQIFYGPFATGQIDLSEALLPVGAAPEWFGAVGDNTTNDLDAITALKESAAKVFLFMSPAGYHVSDDPAITLPDGGSARVAGEVANGSTVYLPKGLWVKDEIRADSLKIDSDIEVDGNATVHGNATVDVDLSVGRDATIGRNLGVALNATVAGALQANSILSQNNVEAFDKVIAGTYVQAQAGSSGTNFKASGSKQVVIGSSDNTLDANSLTATNDYIKIIAAGTTDSATPTVSITVGGTTVFSASMDSSAGTTADYYAEVLVFRTGATSFYSTGFVTMNATGATRVPAASDSRSGGSITWANANAIVQSASATNVKKLTMHEIYPAS